MCRKTHLLKVSAILLFLIFLSKNLPGAKTPTIVVPFSQVANQKIHGVHFLTKKSEMNISWGKNTPVCYGLGFHRDRYSLKKKTLKMKNRSDHSFYLLGAE